MRSTLPAIAALLVGVALLLVGNGLQNTLLPLRAQLEAFSPFEIGLLGSSYFLGFALGGYYGPHLVQRVGHIRCFTAMVATVSAVVLAYSLVREPVIWWGLRILTGVCFAAIYIVIESWLNERSTNETRGTVFAIYSIIGFVTLAIGQLLLPLASPSEFQLFILSSILVSVASVPVALTKAAQPSPVASIEVKVGGLFKISPVGFVGCLAVGAANGCFWSLAPIFAQGDSGDTEQVAAFMALVIFTGAIGQWPLGFFSDRMDRRIVIVVASVVSAGAGAALALLSGLGGMTVLVLAAIYGAFAFPIYSLSVAHVNDFVDPEHFVEAASGLSLIWGAGAVLGPLIGSAAVGAIGPQGLFAVTAALHASLALFALYRMRRRAAAAQEERGDFLDAMRVSTMISTIDPHEDDEIETPAEPDAAPAEPELPAEPEAPPPQP